MKIQPAFIKLRQIFHCLFIRPYNRAVFGSLGKHSYVPVSVRLEKPENIHIGNNVSLGRMSWLAANPLTGCQSCRLTIGDGTYVGNMAHIYCTSKIEIGKKVLFADRVYVADNLHSYNNVNVPVIDQPVRQTKDVFIGDGAWIGENVCIIGSNVGRNSVIGANSVVTRDIPDYCVAVGSPAVIIKRYSIERREWLNTDIKVSGKEK